MKIKLANGSVIEYLENVDVIRGNRSRNVLWANAEESEERDNNPHEELIPDRQGRELI